MENFGGRDSNEKVTVNCGFLWTAMRYHCNPLPSKQFVEIILVFHKSLRAPWISQILAEDCDRLQRKLFNSKKARHPDKFGRLLVVNHFVISKRGIGRESCRTEENWMKQFVKLSPRQKAHFLLTTLLWQQAHWISDSKIISEKFSENSHLTLGQKIRRKVFVKNSLITVQATVLQFRKKQVS